MSGNELTPYIAFSTGKWHWGAAARTETLNGIYDRKANTTRMYAEKEGIKDDLTGFMAFHPKACSAQGEYGMIIDAGEVMTWLEENPEAAENEKLSALKELTDDSNPVVIITVPK